MKTATMSQSFMTEHLIQQIGKLQEKDERSDQQRIDLLLLVQETINDSHRRRLDERREEMEQTIKEGVFEQLKVAIPIILNRVAGKPLLPEQDKSFMLMAALLENLRPEQQVFLRDTLDPNQSAVLAEILGEYEKKKASFMGPSRGVGTREITGEQIPGQQPLVLDNALPPPMEDGEQSPNNTLAKMFQNVKERVSTGADTQSDDEVIQKLERLGRDFNSRMAELHKPPGKSEK